jgi:hypothetical protein
MEDVMIVDVMFKIDGCIGLLLACIGILSHDRKNQDAYYLASGIFLELYSIHLKDILFIILEVVFTVAALYDYIKTNKLKKAHK